VAFDDSNPVSVGDPTRKSDFDVAFDNTIALHEGTIEHDKIGIGTAAIPHGAKGMALLAIEGADSSTSGPHVQITTDSDDYPLFQIKGWAHDDMGLCFDCYHDGSNFVSSDAGSNYLITKAGDLLKFYVDTGTAAGANLSVIAVGCFNTAGHVGFGTVSVDTSALLELDSTTGALLLPRMTEAQRDALTAVNGMVIYSTDNNRIEAYENGAWVDL